MPRVSSVMLVHLAAPPDAVRAAAIDRLAAAPTDDSTLTITPAPHSQPPIVTTLQVKGTDDGTDVAISTVGTVSIPFFSWFFHPLSAIARRRTRAYTAA